MSDAREAARPQPATERDTRRAGGEATRSRLSDAREAARPQPAAGQDAQPAASRSTDPTPAVLWRRFRAPLLIVLLVLAVAAVIAYLGRQDQHGALDPRSPDPQGSMALARLLGDHGVGVRVATTPDNLAAELAGRGSDATVLVPGAVDLDPRAADELARSSADLVLVAPGQSALDAFTPGVRAVAGASGTLVAPGCALPAAARAGDASLGGVLFDVDQSRAPQTVGCYPDGSRPSLLRYQAGTRAVTLVGASDPFRDDELATGGNAALTLGLLGARPRLVWYVPAPPAPGGGDRSLFSLLPVGWQWATWQVGLGVALLALWRARRLGPVVSEPLPVRVRAAETVEGRGRLYARARARARAAEALRAATRRRLLPLAGLPPTADPAALAAALAARVGGSEARLHAVLHGPAPADDAALIHLADALDALEKEVRRP